MGPGSCFSEIIYKLNGFRFKDQSRQNSTKDVRFIHWSLYSHSSLPQVCFQCQESPKLLKYMAGDVVVKCSGCIRVIPLHNLRYSRCKHIVHSNSYKTKPFIRLLIKPQKCSDLQNKQEYTPVRGYVCIKIKTLLLLKDFVGKTTSLQKDGLDLQNAK